MDVLAIAKLSTTIAETGTKDNANRWLVQYLRTNIF